MVDSAFQIWNAMRMIDLTDLRVFMRIIDLGSLSGAARNLGMPKSSVSRSLVRLEDAIGAALVERSTTYLRLTDAGLLLQRHARRILDDVGEATDAVRGLGGAPRGDLRISAPFTFATGPLAPMLPAFMARYPDVRVILTVDNRTVDMLTEDIDVAIRIGPLADSELIAKRLAVLELWPCASPAYLALRGTPAEPDDLTTHAVIGHAVLQRDWQFTAKTGVVKAVTLQPIAIIPEPDVVRTLLIAGSGIGLLPDFHARDAVADGALIRMLPEWSAGRVDVHALYPSHRSLSAKVRVFIDALAAHLAPEGRHGRQ
jgi:DNA-binding transcriptional LysR family regulator